MADENQFMTPMTPASPINMIDRLKNKVTSFFGQENIDKLKEKATDTIGKIKDKTVESDNKIIRLTSNAVSKTVNPLGIDASGLFKTESEKKKEKEIKEIKTSDKIDEAISIYQKEKADNLQEEDRDNFIKLNSYNTFIRNSEKKFNTLLSEVETKMSSLVLDIGGTANEQLEQLNRDIEEGKIKTQEEVKGKYDLILEKAGVKDKIEEIQTIQTDNLIKSYAIVSGMSEDEIKAIYEKSGETGVERVVAGILNVPPKQLHTMVGKKIDEMKTHLRDKYDIDIDIENKQKYSSRDGNLIGIQAMFSTAGVPLLDTEKKEIMDNAFPEPLKTTDGFKNEYMNSIAMELNKEMLDKLKGGALLTGKNKEDGTNYWERYRGIIVSPEYNAVMETIRELMGNENLFNGQQLDRSMFIDVLNSTPERKALSMKVDNIEEELEISAVENGWIDTSFDIKGLKLGRNDLFKGVAIGSRKIVKIYNDWTDESTQSEISAAGQNFKDRKAYTLDGEGRQEFIDKKIQDRRKSDATQDIMNTYKANTFGERIVSSFLKTIRGTVDSPYSKENSDIMSEFQRRVLENDPIYMSNAAYLYADIVKDIGGVIINRPADVLTLAASFAAGKTITSAFRLLANTKKGINIGAKIASLTTSNPNSKLMRGASRLMFKGLENMFDTTSIGFNTFFLTYSDATGLNPLMDIGLDGFFGVLGGVLGMRGGVRKVSNDIYDIYKRTGGGPKFGLALHEAQLLNPYITPESLDNVAEVISATKRWFTDATVGKAPKDMENIILKDALYQKLTSKDVSIKEAKNKLLPSLRETNEYKILKAAGMKDEKIMLDLLERDGQLNLATLKKYNFIKGEYELNKEYNPLLKNIDTMFKKIEEIDFKGNAEARALADQLIAKAKGQAVVNVMGIYSNGPVWGNEAFGKSIDEISTQIAKVGGGEIAKQVEMAVKSFDITKSVNELSDLYNKGQKTNIEDSIKVWDKLSNGEKAELTRATVEYVNITKDNDFLKKLGLNEKEIKGLYDLDTGAISNRGEGIIANKLAGKMNVGGYSLDISNYSNKVDEFLRDSGFFKSESDYNRFNLMKSMVRGIDDGTLKIHVLNDEARELYTKISPFINVMASDRKALMILEMAQISALDNIISTYKTIGKMPQKKLGEFVRNIISDWGKKFYGALRPDVKGDLLKSLNDIDVKLFLKDKGLPDNSTVDEVLSYLIEDRFQRYVLGGKGMIGKRQSKSGLTNKIDRLLQGYINSVEGTTKYVTKGNAEEGIVATAEMLSKKVVKSNRKAKLGTYDVEYVSTDIVDGYKAQDRNTVPKFKDGEVDELVEQIKKDNNIIKEPLIITYYQKDKTAILGEGNTRLAAAKKLGIDELPVMVIRLNSEGTSEGAKKVSGFLENEHGYVPGNLLPSEIGIGTKSDGITEEKILHQAMASTSSRPQKDVVRSGIDILGAARTTAIEDIIYKIGDTSVEDLSRLIISAHYNNSALSLDIMNKVGDNGYNKYIQAVEIAKARKGQAIELLPKFFDGENILSEITFEGRKIRLASVLNNLDYKFTKDGLITTMPHNIIKYIAGADKDAFLGLTKNIFDTFSESLAPEILGKVSSEKYMKIVGNVYDKLEEILGNREVVGDVMSRMVVGMPQYIESISKMGADDLITEMVTKKLLKLNKQHATSNFKKIYDDALMTLDNISDFEIDDVLAKNKDSLSLQYLGQREKNYQLAKIDVLISNNLNKSFKMTKEGFEEFLYKAKVGHIEELSIKGVKDIFIKNLGLETFNATFDMRLFSRSDTFIENVLGYLKTNKSNIEKQGIDYNKIVKEIDGFKGGLPDKVIKQEIKSLQIAGDRLYPGGKSLDEFYSDTKVSQDVYDEIQKASIDNMTNAMATSSLIDFKKTGVKNGKQRFMKGVNKVLGAESELNDFFDTANVIKLIGDLAGEDKRKARQLLLESGLTKKLFEIPGKISVNDASKGWKNAGEIMFTEDEHYSKVADMLGKVSKTFGNPLSLMGRDKELNTVIMELERAKYTMIDIKGNRILAQNIPTLWKEGEFIGDKTHLINYIQRTKKALQNMIKENNISKSTLQGDFTNVSKVYRKPKEYAEFLKENNSKKPYYDVIAGYLQSVGEARKKLGVGYLDDENLYQEFIVGGVFSRGKDTADGAVKAVEGLDGLRIGLDKNTYQKLGKKIQPYLGEWGFKHFIYNMFKEPEFAVGTIEKTLRLGYKAEKTASNLMYGMLFSTPFGTQLGLQQLFQNLGHRYGKSISELSSIDISKADDVLEAIADIEKFDMIAGQKQLNLLDSNGKGIRAGIDNTIQDVLFRISAQSMADRAVLKKVQRSSLTAAFLEYGYDNIAINQLFDNIADIQSKLSKHTQYMDIKKMLFNSEDKIKYAIQRKLLEEGVEGDEAIKIVREIIDMKKSLGNAGEVFNSYYSKLGAFYQFSAIPGVTQSFAANSSKLFGQTAMKFMNRATKKAGQYAIDRAYAIKNGDKDLMTRLGIELIAEGIYTAKMASYADRLAGDNEIDPVFVMMNLYTPTILINMVTQGAMEDIYKNMTKDDTLVDAPFSAMGYLGNIADGITAKLGMGLAYRASILASPYKTKEELERMGGPDEIEMAGRYWNLLSLNIQNKLLDRGLRYSLNKTSGQAWFNYDDPKEALVNNIMGGVTTERGLRDQKLIRNTNELMYGQKDAIGLDAKILYVPTDNWTIRNAFYNRLEENGVYDMLSMPADKLKELDDKKNKDDTDIVQLYKELEKSSTYLDDSEGADDRILDMQNGTYTVFNSVISELTKFESGKNIKHGLSYVDDIKRTPEQEEAIANLEKDITDFVVANKKATKMLDNVYIKDITSKYTSELGQKQMYGVILRGMVNGYKTIEKERISNEKHGVRYTKIGDSESKRDVMQEVNKLGAKYALEILSANSETITSLDKNIPVKLAKDYATNVVMTEGINSNLVLGMENTLWNETVKEDGIQGVATMYNFMNKKSLNNLSKLPEKTPEQIKKKHDTLKDVVNQFVGVLKSDVSAGVKFGITQGWMEYIETVGPILNELEGEDKEVVQEALIEAGNVISKSGPISDEKIWELALDKHGLLNPSTGSKKSSKLKLGETVKKLNKFQKIVDDAKTSYFGKPPAISTRYSTDGWNIQPIQISRTELPKDELEIKFFPPPKIETKKIELAVEGEIKKIGGRKFTPKEIKKIKKKFN